MRFLSCFSGIEAASVAFLPLGWECVGVAEVEPFPCAVLAHHYPDVPNLGDVTADDFLQRASALRPDVLVGGPPCFPAGTMVATARGHIPIEDVRVGDEVLTHTGRFRRVDATGSKVAPTWVLRGQGHPDMVTTANHPFLSRKRQSRSTRIQGKSVRLVSWSSSEWTRAEDMAGRHWAMPVQWPHLPIPPVELEGNERIAPALGTDLMWLAGAYVGDGWTRMDERRGSVIYGLNESKRVLVTAKLDALALSATEAREQTVVKVHVHGRALARWMRENFGSGAAGKHIPMWLLGAPKEWRQAFVAGYAATDGTVLGCPSWASLKGLTVSRSLALGMRMLGISLGFASSVSTHSPKPTTIIEGREVNQRPHWTFMFSTSERSSVLDESAALRWQLVRGAEPTGRSETVYDLTVDEDHSYVADGIVVHNCQDFSVAGLRAGLGGDRGNLSLRWVEIIRAIRPAFAVTENVPGWLSVNKGHAFGAFLAGLVGHDTALIPPRNCGGRWTNAGMVAGPLGRVAWRVLDAQFFNLAQRRQRVFAVFCPRDGADPAKVLFEPACLQGHSPPRRETRERTSAGAVCGALPSGGTPNGHGTAGVNSQAVAAGHVIATGLEVRRLPGDERGDVVPDVRMVRPRAYGCGVVANPLGAKRDGGWRGDLDNDTYAVVPLLEIGKGSSCAPNGIGIGAAGDPMFTLQAGAQHGVAVALRGREGGGVAELGGDCAHAIRASQGGGDKPHVLAFDARQSDVIQYGDRSGPLDTDWHTVAVAVSAETVYGVRHGTAPETSATQALRALRDAVGEETVSQWCLGVLAAFWPAEVLRSAVHGRGVRCEAQPKRGLVNVALSRAQAGCRWSVRDLWEAGCDGCPPPRWQPSEQLARELGAYLSGLPHSPSPAEGFLHDMWRASEGAWLLREALSAVQEARRSACGEGQSVRICQAGHREQSQEDLCDVVVQSTEPRERVLRQARSTGQARAHPTAAVRRLVPEEAEALQGFPRGYTLIQQRGKPAADGPRYRALGNSFAVPVVRWIGERIAAQEAEAQRKQEAA